jgi:hypothetical protein
MRSAVDDASAASAARAKTRPRPRTEEELLAREETRALRGILDAGERMLADASSATGLRERVRRHPWIAVAVASAGGVAAGRVALRLLRLAASLGAFPALVRLLSAPRGDPFLRSALRRASRE